MIARLLHAIVAAVPTRETTFVARHGEDMKSARMARGTWERRMAWMCVAGVLALCVGCESSDSGSHSGEVTPGTYLITVYYTAVESYHGGRRVTVRGRLSADGGGGEARLGDFPSRFAQAVEEEGTGRITSGPHAGRYLNWSYDTGFWLDDVPANAYGASLRPFRTAAADTAVLPRGTRFRLVPPLIQDNGSPLDNAVASRLLAAEWLVDDQFTPGLGGAYHLDLYIGEEDRPDFTASSPLYITLKNTGIEMR